MVNVSNRIDFVDISRTITLYLVVLGHILLCAAITGNTNNAIFTTFLWIYSFHMPLFFFLSGYCFKESQHSTIQYIYNKIKSLIFPYLGFCILGILISIIADPRDSLDYHRILSEVFWEAKPLSIHVGPVWFLIALFWGQIFFFLLNRYIKNLYVIGILGIILLCITYLGFVCKPLKLSSGIIGLFFMIIGCYCRRIKLFERISQNYRLLRFAIILLLVSLNYIGAKQNGFVDVSECCFGKSLPGFVFNSFLGVFCDVQLALLLPPTKLSQFIARNSLWIFALHGLFVSLFMNVYNRLVVHSTTLASLNSNAVISCVIYAALAFLVLMTVSCVPYLKNRLILPVLAKIKNQDTI